MDIHTCLKNILRKTSGVVGIENAPSLTNEKVDKGVYESVRGKLTNLTEKSPAPEYKAQMPSIVDESSKFLAAPFPESEAEKRRVLADLMARKEDEILGQEGIYKLTYKEGGEEILNAPVGVVNKQDEETRNLLQKVNAVIPEKKLQTLLREPANEGSTYLSDIIKGRGEAMQVLHDEMEKEKDKELITIGKFSKTHGQAAKMLETAPHFGGQQPSPVIVDKVAKEIESIPTTRVHESAKPYIPDASNITTQYIAGIATKECGLDAKALAALDDKESVGGTIEKKDGRVKDIQLSDEERRRREAEEALKEEERRRKLDEAKRRQALLEQRKRRGAQEFEFDPEREQAMQILHGQLRSRGGEVFYEQTHTELTHGQASEWLSMKPPMKVDKSVKESGDTTRLHKKFERKLSNIVTTITPAEIHDTMQDVIIESSRILSEYFVSKNYKALVEIALISEMQKRVNEILTEVDGITETFFFAAQRLKKATSLETNELCSEVSYHLTKKLEDVMRCRSMPRKLTSALKEHIKVAADYLSANVTKPDEHIEAYVALLNEMEAAGDGLLIEGNIPKTYKEAASYLRQLTTFQDLISLPNSTLQSNVTGKLKSLMANVSSAGYSKSVMDGVINESTQLLVSYIMLQGVRTEVLKILIDEMDNEGDNVLLRHGQIRKSFSDGADLLRSKNTDQLSVQTADPVVARKIQIKLRKLMQTCTPDKHKSLIDDVIEDATMYLAVHFFRPRVMPICKCMKNVFVQCELWCDEILRRVAKPCCTCPRHISAEALADVIGPGTSRSNRGLSIMPCPSKPNRVILNQGEKPYVQPCPAKKPTAECEKNTTVSYLLHSNVFKPQSSLTKPRLPPPPPSSPTDFSFYLPKPLEILPTNIESTTSSNLLISSEITRQESDASSPESFHTPLSINSETEKSQDRSTEHSFWHTPTTMFATTHPPVPKDILEQLPSANKTTYSFSRSRGISSAKLGYNSRAPIVTTDQMTDWHSMMVSLLWNVQAWRNWIQENIDRAVTCPCNSKISYETEDSWTTFQRQIETEAMQWKQYNNFSRQLTLRLALRYKDKKIVSPTRATVKTEAYMKCQDEMLDIIDMFSRWTRWLTVVIKETDSLQQQTNSNLPMHILRWKNFKQKVEEYQEDWNKYNLYLKVCWEQKYKALITDWLPGWNHTGPVWVVSACGAVPGGAVAAGVFEGEVIWVARTTHRCNVLPAALQPSKHCCIVYSDGGVHYYTKYQVMCNASVSWVACRAGDACGARAVRVSRGVHVGRVLYRGAHLVGAVHAPAHRCHVVIFGRPFAFTCYELLVLNEP